jgi:drug/metabolite transporter (DMT)-like permease
MKEHPMADSTRRPIAAAVAGAACIASSAVVMRLAGSSASTAALCRCAFALPVLGVLAIAERRRGAPLLAARSRWLARLSGVFLAGDLILWSHSISAIGAGLATVVTNLQVLIVALLAWWILGERPRRSLLLASPVMFAGLTLVAGLAGAHAYGTRPGIGVILGVAVAILYTIFILMLRHATVAPGPGGTPGAVAGPLFESTLGAAATSLVIGYMLHDFRLGHAWPALGWLVLLALTSQVLGWMLITVSMPRLPAWLVSALLLVQPAGSVALSAMALGERPSPEQLLGVALILAGVLIAASGRTRPAQPGAAGREGVPQDAGEPAVRSSA